MVSIAIVAPEQDRWQQWEAKVQQEKSVMIGMPIEIGVQEKEEMVRMGRLELPSVILKSKPYASLLTES
ncbi:hypothetical protein FY550_06665 [Kushneria phosphatilytica]|uniref:Uncharacterized protein n=2 Tax=Kushneria phosphatilytica TaxID=657387 RepID=A0A5C1A1R4_9GAMM|nr:hypothetical protein [Kushneria phosphatilytica]QEL10835.1 hypothetical protein FY550_06665 [Kushneria phosphatilytica]